MKNKKNSLINEESLEALKSLINVIYPEDNKERKSNEKNGELAVKYKELLKLSEKYTDEEIKEILKNIPNNYNRAENQKNAENLANLATNLNIGEDYLVDTQRDINE